MSVLGKSITALGAFEIMAGTVTSMLTGDAGAGLAGVFVGSATLAGGLALDCADERGADAAAPVEIAAPEQPQP